MAHRRDWLPNPLHTDGEHDGDPALAVERTDTVSRLLVIARPGVRFRFIGRRAVQGGRAAVQDTIDSDWIPLGNEAGDLVLRPILLDVRPLDRTLGVRSRARSLAAGAQTAIWRHESLVVLDEPADKNGWKHSWWVDPDRDFVVRRHLLIHAADTMVEQTISYFRAAGQTWLPCRWMTLRRKNHPGLWISDQAWVTAVRVNGAVEVVPAQSDRTACR